MESPRPKSSPENRIPFRDELVESSVSEIHVGLGKLLELKGDPTKIVRIEKFEKLNKRFHGVLDPVSLAGIGRRLYKEFETNYGIPAPVEYVAGEDESGGKVIYGIAEKINGENLVTAKVTPELAIEVEKLYATISQYYLDKHSRLEDEEALVDLNHCSQYVYGTSAGESHPKIYLVDTDLFFVNNIVMLLRAVAWFWSYFPHVEQRFGKRFEEARKNVEQIVASVALMELDEKEKKMVEQISSEIKKFMSSSSPMEIYND